MATGPNLFDPKYGSGAEQARQDVMVGVSVGMTLIGVTCVALRVYTRAFIVRKMGIEDWTMVAAATLTMVFLLQLIAGAIHLKLGFSGMNLTPEQTKGTLKLILAIIVVYKMTVTLIKLSILMIYLRLSVTRTFKILCKATMALLILWQIVVTAVVPTQCTPLRKVWDLKGEVQGHCINANAFYHTTSAFHIAMDIWILVLPIRMVLRIPRPPREKIVVFVIFGLGIVSTIASIIRLQSLRIFTLSNDPNYDSLPINTWSMVEVNIGIVCACVPTLKPLVGRAQRYRGMGREDEGGSKVPILKTGKDLMISLHPGTHMKSVDEEWVLDDRPPPPPPKDEGCGAKSRAESYREAIRYPDKAFF